MNASTQTDTAPIDTATTSSPVPDDRVGALRGTATLTLQTREAHRLVKGRAATADKPAIIGLLAFANLLRPIWHGVLADDPWADWWLLRVHQALDLAQDGLATAIESVRQHTSADDPLEVGDAQSTKSIRVALQFSNPYAFRGARLVARFDDLARSVLTARHVGLITPNQAEDILNQGGRLVRRAFQGPLGYRMTGVTRRDLAEASSEAAAAREAMGEAPEEVLNRTQRAPHAPEPRRLNNLTELFLLQPLPDPD